MSFDEVIAQPAPIRVLRKAASSDRVASSYLFEGPSGVGKQLAAIALAQANLCPESPGKGCGTCALCRRINEGKHPDVRVFGPREEGSRNIQVEALREQVLPFAQYAPFEAEAAFLIFPEADVSFPPAHPESANALLKTLEEPRPRVHFVLLSERPDRLLPTIRSRCQALRFSRLPNNVLERILMENGVHEKHRQAAAALADGRADRALSLADSGQSDQVLERAMQIDASVESNKPGTLLSLAEELSRSEDLELSLDTLATFYRDVAAAALGLPTSALAFRQHASEVRSRAQTLGASRAAARVNLIMRATDTFERNANKQIVLDSLLLSLKHA